MPALVNYTGDGTSFYRSADGRLRAISSHADASYPPHKRARTFSAIVEDSNKRASINVLPDECLFEVFRHVSEAKERSMCAFVSKHWLMMMGNVRKAEIYKKSDAEMTPFDGEESDGFLSRCLEGKKATDVRLASIAVGTSSRGSLGKLSIRGSHTTRGVTNLGLSTIARGCPYLKDLSMWDVPGVGDKGLIAIAEECHLLEKLDLCRMPLISNKGLIAIAENCPNLTTLNIDSCANIGNEGLAAIGKFCPKLNAICIKDCPLIGDHGISSLLTSTSNSLTKVKLQSLKISDFTLGVMGRYGKSIKNLVLCGLQNVSDRGFWVMGNAEGLQSLLALTISSCCGVTDGSLGAIGKGSPNLNQMCLRNCCFVSDSGLIGFVKAAKYLEVLHLEECNRVSHNGIIGSLSNLKSLTLVKCMGIKETPLEIAIPSCCDSLQSLCIRNCSSIGDTSLALIGKLCPRLQNVELSGLWQVTDTGLFPLVLNSKANLVKMDLTGCVNVTDDFISLLVCLQGSTLEILKLSGCVRITDLSLMNIARNCDVLSELDLSKCAISDSGVAFLSQANQFKLRMLSLSRCSGISNKCIPFLIRIGQTLTGLNIQTCNSISSSSVEILTETLWRCDILA